MTHYLTLWLKGSGVQGIEDTGVLQDRLTRIGFTDCIVWTAFWEPTQDWRVLLTVKIEDDGAPLIMHAFDAARKVLELKDVCGEVVNVIPPDDILATFDTVRCAWCDVQHQAQKPPYKCPNCGHDIKVVAMFKSNEDAQEERARLTPDSTKGAHTNQ